MKPTANQTGVDDFDFVIGNWTVQHRRLKERLVGCTEWLAFEGTARTQKILGGLGNVEDNFLALPDGAYRAAAIRSFNPRERGNFMNSIVYIVGLVVIVIAILSFFGLR